MSFRIEEKISITKENLFLFYKFLLKNKAFNLYPSRNINSIYFDNDFFQMFYDSEEGVVPRKKIRIRSYNGFVDSLLELKISSVEGKFKKSEIISKNKVNYYLANGFNDKNYGLCYPMSKVSYDRSYYLINKDLRLTIDKNMQYKSYNNKSFYFKDLDNLILEIKMKNRYSIDALENIIPLYRIRFSKYCTSIDKLFNNNYEQKLRINL